MPSLLPGHYAIIKGREEGRGKGKQWFVQGNAFTDLYSPGDGMLPTVPSLLPGHYAIIKGREEGR